MANATDDEVHKAYGRFRAEATALAGRPEDIPQRAAVLHSIFLDSAGGHAFPQVALHGALWSAAFFDVSGTLGNLISYRYFYNATKRRARHAMLNNFAVGFCLPNAVTGHVAKYRFRPTNAVTNCRFYSRACTPTASGEDPLATSVGVTKAT